MRSILVLCALLFTYSVSGQLTLNQSSYPASVIGTDSIKITTYASAFPSLIATADGVWDMSIVTDSAPAFFAYRIPAALPYQFADSNMYSLPNFNYQGDVLSSVMSSAILQYGIKIEKTEYSLTVVTGSFNDSLIINLQIAAYSAPHTRIAFPATYGTAWSSSFVSDVTFQLSLGAYGYSYAPGIKRRITTQKDTVTGWGKMRIKDAGGGPSDYLNVLQVKTMITTTDSFYINGVPMPGLHLAMLSLSQGSTITTYQQNYYRPQEVTPLAQVTFSDATYTQPVSAKTHIQRLAAVGLGQLENDHSVVVYPNPVTGNTIYLDFPTGQNDFSYQLINITGSVVKSGMLKSKSTHGSIDLPPSLPAGNYYLKLKTEHGTITRQVDIVK